MLRLSCVLVSMWCLVLFLMCRNSVLVLSSIGSVNVMCGLLVFVVCIGNICVVLVGLSVLVRWLLLGKNEVVWLFLFMFSIIMLNGSVSVLSEVFNVVRLFFGVGVF